ncbi:MAG: M1 family peptidase [Betaproteobacteria bacterium]|nr:M1 family peptidase [Betaproteobacteria bacterium]
MRGEVLRSAASLFLVIALSAVEVRAIEEQVVDVDFEVTLDPVSRWLDARGRVVVPAGEARMLRLAAPLDGEARADGRLLVQADPGGAARKWIVPASTRPTEIEVSWQGQLAAVEPGIDHRQTLGPTAAASGIEGTFLPASSGWYPGVDGLLMRYRLTLVLPPGQRGLVPGHLEEERFEDRRTTARFEFAQPVDGIDLMAGPYVVQERMVMASGGRPLRLRTWFFPGMEDLAPGYLDSVAGHIERYEAWIGPYAFDGFSVVASPTPTGFGMPGLTYLGKDALRLPFIRSTSLGHEVLHCWWGNGVYPDPSGGNWSEGLTTFMADYRYKEDQGPEAARAARAGWLRDIAAVPPGQDGALSEFRSRTHAASQVLGYQKAAMLFHVLRETIGTAAFDAGVRDLWQRFRFRRARWEDLRDSWSKVSGTDLDDFFSAWLDTSGTPVVRMDNARTIDIAGRAGVRLILRQEGAIRPVRVPVAVRAPGKEMRIAVTSSAQEETVEVVTGFEPAEVILDPDADALRRLSSREALPILRDVMAAERPSLLVLSPDESYRTAAGTLAERFADTAPRPVPEFDSAAGAAIIVGPASAVAGFLARHPGISHPPLPSSKSARVWTAQSPAGSIVVVEADEMADLRTLGRLLPHYGGQSWLVLEGGRVISRGVWPLKPQRIELTRSPASP